MLEDRILGALDAMYLSKHLSWKERKTLQDRQLGFTNKEIAKSEGVTERAIEVRVAKIRARFRDLDQYGL
jgi:FixJ family two-component response regulator